MTLDPQQVTIITLLFAIGAAGLARKWVFGWVYDSAVKSLTDALTKMEQDRNFWRDAFLVSAGHTDKALEAVKRVKDG